MTDGAVATLIAAFVAAATALFIWRRQQKSEADLAKHRACENYSELEERRASLSSRLEQLHLHWRAFCAATGSFHSGHRIRGEQEIEAFRKRLGEIRSEADSMLGRIESGNGSESKEEFVSLKLSNRFDRLERDIKRFEEERIEKLDEPSGGSD